MQQARSGEKQRVHARVRSIGAPCPGVGASASSCGSKRVLLMHRCPTGPRSADWRSYEPANLVWRLMLCRSSDESVCLSPVATKVRRDVQYAEPGGRSSTCAGTWAALSLLRQLAKQANSSARDLMYRSGDSSTTQHSSSLCWSSASSGRGAFSVRASGGSVRVTEAARAGGGGRAWAVVVSRERICLYFDVLIRSDVY